MSKKNKKKEWGIRLSVDGIPVCDGNIFGDCKEWTK